MKQQQRTLPMCLHQCWLVEFCPNTKCRTCQTCWGSHSLGWVFVRQLLGKQSWSDRINKQQLLFRPIPHWPLTFPVLQENISLTWSQCPAVFVAPHTRNKNFLSVSWIKIVGNYSCWHFGSLCLIQIYMLWHDVRSIAPRTRLQLTGAVRWRSVAEPLWRCSTFLRWASAHSFQWKVLAWRICS